MNRGLRKGWWNVYVEAVCGCRGYVTEDLPDSCIDATPLLSFECFFVVCLGHRVALSFYDRESSQRAKEPRGPNQQVHLYGVGCVMWIIPLEKQFLSR